MIKLEWACVRVYTHVHVCMHALPCTPINHFCPYNVQCLALPSNMPIQCVMLPSNIFPMVTMLSHPCHGYKVLHLAVPWNTFAMDTRCYTRQSHETPLPWIQGVTPGSPIKHLCHQDKVLCLAVSLNTVTMDTRCCSRQSHQIPLPWIQGVMSGSLIKHRCHGYKVLPMAVPSNTFAMDTGCFLGSPNKPPLGGWVRCRCCCCFLRGGAVPPLVCYHRAFEE